MTTDPQTSAEAELARLRAGEEPGGDPHTFPTPGQWIARFNQATPERRLNVVQALLNSADRADRCFFQAHEKRVHSGRHAEMALAEVRHVIADMEGVTGARTWADGLRKAIERGPDHCLMCAAQEPADASGQPADQALLREHVDRLTTLLTVILDNDSDLLPAHRVTQIEAYLSPDHGQHCHDPADQPDDTGVWTPDPPIGCLLPTQAQPAAAEETIPLTAVDEPRQAPAEVVHPGANPQASEPHTVDEQPGHANAYVQQPDSEGQS